MRGADPNRLITGENSYREAYSGSKYFLHAEMDLLRKLKKSNHLKSESLIVIRLGEGGCLRNSKPCFKCIQHIVRLNKKKITNIKNIYYSGDEGEIIKVKLKDMEEELNKHASAWFKHNQYS